MLDLEIPLTDKQSELYASMNEVDVTGYGGAKGGGKSHGLRSVLLLFCLTFPGLVAAIFRRTYGELQENHIDPLLSQFPELRAYYKEGKKGLWLPNSSILKFRYCKHFNDVEKYAGREYHKVGIEEAGDWPAEMAFKLVRNCNRSTRSGIRATSALAFNWGGIGHGGLKRIFWTRDLREHERKLTFHFILAKVEDNPAILENDPGYLERLESEPNEALRRAYRHGDPNIVAGQYFDIDQAVHLVTPFKIPSYWTWFGAYDYGYNHPAVFGIFVVDGDGRVTLVHEIAKPKLGIPEQADEVHAFLSAKVASGEMTPRARDEILFQAGHDCWAKKKAKDPTIAEDFLNEDVVGRGKTITLVKANISRKLGAHRVRDFLSHKTRPDGTKVGPNFQLFKTCIYTVDCLTRMVHDPDDVEDVLKVDATNGDPLTGDDPYDMTRYGLMSRPALFLPKAPGPTRGSDEWKKKEAEDLERSAEEEFTRRKRANEGWGSGWE